MKKLLSMLLVIVVALAVTLGWRWYGYVTNTDSPYDEVGIELNSRMPLPLRKWGCDRLKTTFGAALRRPMAAAPGTAGPGSSERERILQPHSSEDRSEATRVARWSGLSVSRLRCRQRTAGRSAIWPAVSKDQSGSPCSKPIRNAR